MKQLFKPLSILLLVIISALWTSASAVVIDGIYYYLEGDEATVTNKAQDHLGYSSSAYTNAYSGSITIPSTVTYEGNTYTVRNIQTYAFYNCPDLKAIIIPSTVTSIAMTNWNGNASCFNNCTSLKTFIVSADNPNYSAVGGVLFNKDKTTLLKCPQAKSGEYTIPSTVNTINDYAFSECSNITSISLPNSITSIGASAFSGCTSLSSPITIPTGVKVVSNNAFAHCSALTSVTIPEGVEEIGEFAFYYCTNLKEQVLPSTINKLGIQCFSECNSLNKINIPNGITDIPESAFSSCCLTSITLPEGLNTIGAGAFAANKNSLTIKLPKSVNYIGDNVFAFNPYSYNIYVYNSPSAITLGGYYALSSATIHVYAPLVDVFKKDANWGKYDIVGDIPIEHPVTSIDLNYSSLAMDPYTEGQLTAIAKPDDATFKDVIYTSSNEDVVMILDNYTGNFMTMEAGTAIITAAAIDGSGVKATCKPE